jgi:hypothetical protein
VVAGALLAIGIVNCGVQNENDPAFALISDYVSNADINIRYGPGRLVTQLHFLANTAFQTCIMSSMTLSV